MFRQYIINEEIASMITEGIDVDFQNKIVSFNDKHENGIDTSLFNPTSKTIDGIEFISMFRRKTTMDRTDDNPLLYALKALKGWTLNKDSIKALFRRFLKITNKLDKKYDTIIKTPSSSSLNYELLSYLNQHLKAEHTITDLFFKPKASDVLMCGIKKGIPTEDFVALEKIIREYIAKDDVFSYKNIPTKLRGYIESGCEIESHSLDYADKINNKDVLIVDDTITTGKTISDLVSSINSTFEPKSITVITLFSSLDA